MQKRDKNQKLIFLVYFLVLRVVANQTCFCFVIGVFERSWRVGLAINSIELIENKIAINFFRQSL